MTPADETRQDKRPLIDLINDPSVPTPKLSISDVLVLSVTAVALIGGLSWCLYDWQNIGIPTLIFLGIACLAFLPLWPLLLALGLIVVGVVFFGPIGLGLALMIILGVLYAKR